MGSDLDAGDGDGGSGARGGAGPGPGPVMELHGLMTLFDQEARSCTGSCVLKNGGGGGMEETRERG